MQPSDLPYRPCVGVMVLNAEGRVWLGRRPDARADPEGRGSWWQMPQGGIDRDEEPRAAALRELFEETGLRNVEIVQELPDWLNYDLPPDLVGKAWGGLFRGQRQKWFAMRFLGSDAEVDISPPPGHAPEFDEWRWAAIGELMHLVVPFKRDVYAHVIDAFRPLAVPVGS